MDKEKLILKNEFILSRIYRLFGCNRVCGHKGNKINLGNSFMKRTRINLCGVGNTIEIASGLSRISHSSITVYGSNCHVVIGPRCNLNHCHLYIEDDGGQILIGKHLSVTGETHLDVIEGTKIEIGSECLFADGIHFRTGDSHSILDLTTGRRINPSHDIIVGNNVWIGQGVSVLKGSRIGNGSIVAMKSLITASSPSDDNCVISSTRILKEKVSWCPQRIHL